MAFVAAILSLSAVILAALGSHLVDMNGLQESWETASGIHMFSAAALFGLAAMLSRQNSRLLLWGTWFVVLGTVIFCGGIYLHVISGYTLPNLVPAGGLLMMLGWLLSAVGLLRKS